MTGRSRPVTPPVSRAVVGVGGLMYLTLAEPPSQDCAIVLVHACPLSIPTGLGRICAPPARHRWLLAGSGVAGLQCLQCLKKR